MLVTNNEKIQQFISKCHLTIKYQSTINISKDDYYILNCTNTNYQSIDLLIKDIKTYTIILISPNIILKNYNMRYHQILIKPIKMNIIYNQILRLINQPTKSDINYIRLKSNYQEINYINYSTKTIYKQKEEFISKDIIQCHRMYLVNINQIKDITKKWIILKNNSTIPIGPQYYCPFMETYNEKFYLSPLV